MPDRLRLITNTQVCKYSDSGLYCSCKFICLSTNVNEYDCVRFYQIGCYSITFSDLKVYFGCKGYSHEFLKRWRMPILYLVYQTGLLYSVSLTSAPILILVSVIYGE